MELVKGSPTLVLLGIWNPAILTPEWLLRHALNKGGKEDVPVQLEFAPFPGLPPRLTIEGIVIQLGRSRLVISAPDIGGEVGLDKIESFGQAILTKLSHTPMQAVGQNFEYVENAPTVEQIEVFSSSNDLPNKCDFEFTSTSQKVITSISFAGRILNLTRTLADGKLRVLFNFHYDVSNAEDAVEKLMNNHSFKENHRYALRIIKSLYDVDLAPQPVELADA